MTYKVITHKHAFKPSSNDNAYICIVCGCRIPARLLSYALKNGATLAPNL